MSAMRASVRLAALIGLAFAWFGNARATETPTWAIAADAPPSALPAPRDAVVVESVIVHGPVGLGASQAPEIRSLDPEAEARVRGEARAVEVLQPVFCPAGASLVHHALTPTAHIVGDVYLRLHEDRDRLFVDIDVVRPPHELVAAAVLVDRERSGLVGSSSATPWSIDGPPPGRSASTCAVWLPSRDEPEASRVLLIRARRIGAAPGTHLEEWSTAESSWTTAWREHAGATRAATTTVVDFALVPIRDLDAFAPPAAAVLARDPASVQEFRATEGDPSAWADALRAIDNMDGMVSTVELSQRALDGSALGVASWCWNEDASWDVAIAHGPGETFRVHVAQTPVDGGVERADLVFRDDDRAGVVFVFAGHPTESTAAGRLVLALRVRELTTPAEDDARHAWDELWDMSR